MSDYIREREYDYSDMVILITEYIVREGSITMKEAMRITGSNRWTVWRILLRIDRVLGMYQDEQRRRVYVQRTQ